MKKIVGLCATFLLIMTGITLDAGTTSRIVMGQVTHTSSSGVEGVESQIVFSTSGEVPITVQTLYDGSYTASVTPNKRYSCQASNEYGSQNKVLTAGSESAQMNFNF